MSSHNGSGGELPHWPTMLRRTASSVSLGPRRRGFGSQVLTSLVKLVLQHSDKQLESIHKQLCTSAMDLARRLTSISTLMSEISAALKVSKPDEQGDRVKMARDWKDISKEYSTCLFDLRSSAISGAATINDFLGEFSDYMCFAEENVNLKREEARLYSERKVAESKQPSEGLKIIKRLSRKISDFRIRWSGTLSSDVETKSVIVLEKLESVTNKSPPTELNNMLDNTSFPGVVSTSMALLPLPWATQLFKLLEGDVTSKVESLRGKTTVLRPLNVLSKFLGVSGMLGKDLNAVDNLLGKLAGQSNLGDLKAKLGIVFMSYSSFSDALKRFADVLSGAPSSSTSRPQARAFEYNHQATFFRMSMVDPNVEFRPEVLHSGEADHEEVKVDDRWSFFLWLLGLLRRMAQQAKKLDYGQTLLHADALGTFDPLKGMIASYSCPVMVN